MKNIFSILKPVGITSHDVVDEIRKITKTKKVGHAGTLDPLASGILIVGVGREATKQLGILVKKEKEYIALIKLGEVSTTDDREGKKTKVNNRKIPTEEVKKAVSKFLGRIKQRPPIFSAVKVGGRRAYKLARKGEKVLLKSREIEIREIEILKYDWPELKLRVVTGPGVYIRALARDIGEELEVGGYLLKLERTRVGDFTKENSYSILEFSNCWKTI